MKVSCRYVLRAKENAGASVLQGPHRAWAPVQGLVQWMTADRVEAEHLWAASPTSCLPFRATLLLSDSLQPHGLQHTRLPRPSLSPGICSNSFPLSQWCYLTISSSAASFSLCLQSFPASGSFPVQHCRSCEFHWVHPVVEFLEKYREVGPWGPSHNMSASTNSYLPCESGRDVGAGECDCD